MPIHADATDWPALDGGIIDVVSGKPVSGATVTVRSGMADYSATTTSGKDGSFHLARHAHQEWVQSDRYEPGVSGRDDFCERPWLRSVRA